MKKTIATVLATLTLMLGIPAVANAATYTARSVRICTYDITGRGYAWLQQRVYIDYDWYVEVFIGKRDFYYVLRTDRTPTVDWTCNVRSA
jgi:hypothetical protein